MIWDFCRLLQSTLPFPPRTVEKHIFFGCGESWKRFFFFFAGVGKKTPFGHNNREGRSNNTKNIHIFSSKHFNGDHLKKKKTRCDLIRNLFRPSKTKKKIGTDCDVFPTIAMPFLIWNDIKKWTITLYHRPASQDRPAFLIVFSPLYVYVECIGARQPILQVVL